MFQNPYGSLNPRQTIGKALEEPLLVNTSLSSAERKAEALSIMARWAKARNLSSLSAHVLGRPAPAHRHRPRAHAEAKSPGALDEPVSALDVSIRAQALNLLASLQEEFALAYVFVSHDLSVVRHIADEVMVIYLGSAVELGKRAAIFDGPQHPIHRRSCPRRRSPTRPPSASGSCFPASRRRHSRLRPGCAFHPRCRLAFDRCRRREARRSSASRGADVACWAVAA